MATKIRLQRHGRKGYAFYHIVVADSRAKRDGKCIERIGSYNPNTNPATIDLNFEKAVKWIGTGAQPTDTARSILSKEGVMMMHHLNGGVAKGSFTAEQATEKFAAWKADKGGKVAAVKNKLATDKAAKAKARLEAEIASNKAKAEAVAAKLAAAAAAAAPVEVAEEVTEEAAAE